jgi:integrase
VKNELSDDEPREFLAAFDDRAGFKGSKRKGSRRAASGGSIRNYQRFAAMKPFFVCAMHTGLRRGELLDLRSTDIRGNFIKRVMNKEKDRTADIPMSSTLKKTLAVLPRRGAYVFQLAGRRLPLSTVRRYFELR